VSQLIKEANEDVLILLHFNHFYKNSRIGFMKQQRKILMCRIGCQKKAMLTLVLSNLKLN